MQPKCAWCDRPAIYEKVTHRAVVRKKGGVPNVIAPETKAPACAIHARIKTVDDPVVARAKNAAAAKSWKSRQEKLC